MTCETIEDLLEIFAGLRTGPKLQIDPNDATIMYSVARQVFKGTALTDRQHILMKDKLYKYETQFCDLQYDFHHAIDNLRTPLRQIDRSKYIQFASSNEVSKKHKIFETQDDQAWIKIRFPFSKKLINDLQKVINLNHEGHLHEKGSHTHYFEASEKIIYKIISIFKDKNFEIQEELYTIYKSLESLKEHEHVPCVYQNKLKNLNKRAVEILENEIGEYSTETAYMYADRSQLYGLKFIDSFVDYNHCSHLTSRICKRTGTQFLIKPSEFNFNSVVKSLIELNRFPLVVLLDEANPYKGLKETYSHLKNIIAQNEVSVQFRLPSKESNGFNEYIAENKLNNAVDKNTKLVYTSKDKLNKPLLQSNCSINSVMLLESMRANTKVQTWINEFDFVIHYDNESSHFYNIQRITEI